MPLNTAIGSEILREKIRLKSINNKAEKDEVTNKLEGLVEERNALVIGNDCVRHMTTRELNEPYRLNARIFAERPRAERISMKRVPLDLSIPKNDGILFRYGKRLMKQDHERVRTDAVKKNQELKLEDAKNELAHFDNEREKQMEMYLHKQVLAENYKDRYNTAKLIYQRMQKILAELQNNSGEFPEIIRNLERMKVGRKKELEEFKGIRDKAEKSLHKLELQLKPLNKELSNATAHFEKAIAAEKSELEERKKHPISKFLAERENHAFNYKSGSNIREMKINARNRSFVNAQDTVLALMDAMLVSDIDYVTDCILDQDDVTDLLKAELKKRCRQNLNLKDDLARLRGNHEALQYDDRTSHKVHAELEEAKANESSEHSRVESLENRLKSQDRLLSEIAQALHALFEKMRPIKLPSMSRNHYRRDLEKDATSTILKLTTMKDLVHRYVVKSSKVKPIMLHFFKERRVPKDSIRVDHAETTKVIQGFDNFEADQPGYVSREMIKQKYEELTKIKNKKR